jgi:tRNA-(ms[2]io[6]A)-hydroxylase
MNLMYRYTGFGELLEKMAQLAREELLHFEQVLRLLRARGIAYDHLGPSRYAASLRAAMRSHEPARLVDILIVGAFVEARSCERFAALAPHVDQELARFYRSLLRSEARHFEDYLGLAKLAAGDNIDARVAYFAAIEAELVSSPDTQFRFHSGPPAAVL